MPHTFFIHSSVDKHLGYFHMLTIVNSATMNTEVYVSFQIRVFVFSGYMCKSRIAHAFVLTLVTIRFPYNFSYF